MTGCTNASVTFAIGQTVPWPHASGGIAQVEDLLRKNVGVLWLDEKGRVRRERVNAGRLADYANRNPLLLKLEPNPYGRGIVLRRKTFNV
jgi:hypothetical protein